MLKVVQKHLLFLLLTPLLFANIGVQVVDPSFSALLSAPIQNSVVLLHFEGDEGPVLVAVESHELDYGLVFLNPLSGTYLRGPEAAVSIHYADYSR